ncbi:MAG: Fic family protein [Paracoccaceae bacterium]|nr:Fic family protein [Paracoccaceae bacterium]
MCSERKSEAEIPPLIDDPVLLAQKEAANALDQFDWAMTEVSRWMEHREPTLRISMLLDLHRKAMSGIDQYAGNFRPASVAIKGSKHAPVPGEEVPRHVEEMLDYLKSNWSEKTASHLSAYAMWRLNWIHPFADGNGRTSRMFSYMILCARLGYRLPGSNTIPEQISEYKAPYYSALEAADEAWKIEKIDVTEMEKLLEGYLAKQLIGVQESATGKSLRLPESTALSKQSRWDFFERRPVLYTSIVTIVIAMIGWAISAL